MKFLLALQAHGTRFGQSVLTQSEEHLFSVEIRPLSPGPCQPLQTVSSKMKFLLALQAVEPFGHSVLTPAEEYRFSVETGIEIMDRIDVNRACEDSCRYLLAMGLSLSSGNPKLKMLDWDVHPRTAISLKHSEKMEF